MNMLFISTILPLIGAMLVALFGRNRILRNFLCLLFPTMTFLMVLYITNQFLNGATLKFDVFKFITGINFSLNADGLSLIFAIVSSFLWIISSVYSIGYMEASYDKPLTSFFCFFAIAIFATIGSAFSANLFTFFVFYEILTISTLPLVMYDRTAESFKSGKKYFMYLIGGSALLLFAMTATYSFAQTLDFSRTGFLAKYQISPDILKIMLIAYVFGLTKAAVMPLHRWLPAAMVAPIPVSALLHAVAVVKVGVFGIIRIIMNVYGLELMQELNMGFILAVIASITILTASIIALRQDNLKLRLAYSTISQLSYMVLGVSLLSKSGLTGGIFHIVSHAFAKITLFFGAGSIYLMSHKKNISELSGIGKKMPYTMAAFSLASLSMVGLPPLSGFISKWYISIGALEAGEIIFLFVILTSSILNAAYFFPIIYTAFFKQSETVSDSIKEASPTVVIPLCVTALITVVLFFYPYFFKGLINLYLKGLL